MGTRFPGDFSVTWVSELSLPPVKIGILAQKRPNFAQNWHFWSFWARPCRLLWFPVGGSVGGYGAGCISQDTYLLYVTYSYPKVYCCGGLRSPCRPPFQLATSLLDHIHLPANCLTLTELRALGQLLSVPLLLNIQDRLLNTIICQLLM